MTGHELPDPLPLTVVDRIDRACDRFEAEWLAGRSPRIEDFLAEVPAEDRPPLLRELLLLERELGRGDGREPTVEEFRARFAGYTGVVDEALGLPTGDDATVTRMNPGGGTRADARATPGGREAGGRGARFVVLRSHAQGGLGQVSVALDRELNREVALKEIRPAHADDEHSRARFVLEAEVTGHLEHPGVVPVYSLGRDDDGRPYYAMRFVRGDTLMEAIRRHHQAAAPPPDPGRRSLEFRQLLGRFVAVCNALAYAHSRGVLHRDVKPANILLGPYGETLLVDWGLAKLMGRGLEAGTPGGAPPVSATDPAVETRADTAVGTPAFMSPEQASGNVERIGPASDVYSLGATLYCLLAGEAPFRGLGQVEMLQKVKLGEFPRPRQVRAEVPRALEAVCLKAMALEPGDRYPSPSALADDVEHWLADEPVSVWREPWSVRAVRWARRHRVYVVGSAALLLSLTVASTVAAVLIGRAKAETDRQQLRAEQNFRLARRAVDDYLTKVSENRLINEPGLQPLRAELLNSALDYYREFVRDREGDRSLRADLAAAYLKMGKITRQTGSRGDGERFIRSALVVTTPDAAEPAGTTLPTLRARAFLDLSHMQRETKRYDEAARNVHEALAIYRRLGRDEPTNPLHKRGLAEGLAALAETQESAKRYAEAEQSIDQAILIGEGLAAVTPAEANGSEDLLEHYLFSAVLHARYMGGGPRAEADFRKAFELALRLVREKPDDLGVRSEFIDISTYLGEYQQGGGRWADSLATLTPALEAARPLARDNPRVDYYQYQLATVDYAIGYSLLKSYRFTEAVTAYREALPIVEKLSRENPAVRRYQNPGPAGILEDLAEVHRLNGEPERAEACLVDALALVEKVAGPAPEVVVQVNLATVHWSLAALYVETGRASAATASAGRALAILEPLAADHPDSLPIRHDLAKTRALMAGARRIDGRAALALDLYEKAVEELAAQAGSNPGLRVELGVCLCRVAGVQAGLGRRAEALASWRRAREYLAAPPKDDPEAIFGLALSHAAHIPLADRPESDAEATVKALRQAVDAGFRDHVALTNDPDLAPLRTRRDFRDLLMDLAFPADPFAR